MMFAATAHAQAPYSYDAHMTRAGEAFQGEDWVAFITELEAAQTIRPYSLYVWRNRILARLLANRIDEAVTLAEKIAVRGLVMEFDGHPAFELLTDNPAFPSIAARMAENAASFGNVNTIVEISDRTLLPEALAYDKNQIAYLGSVRSGKILSTPHNRSEPKIVAVAPGGVFDIEARGDMLWVAVNNQLAYENRDAENAFASVMAINKKKGAFERDIRVQEEATLLGDIEIAKDGTIYASDSITPRLFRMLPDTDSLEVFVENPHFVNLQGIALDEQHNRLFVADYLTGLFVIDANTGTVNAIGNTIDAHLGGIDGLYLYKGDLIAIQNGTTPQRIIRIGLSDDGLKAVRFDRLQQNLEGWNEPTHGAFIDEAFHYIATSNWSSYGQDWNIREGANLHPVRIMTLPLNPK